MATIVVLTDFSDSADNALQYACAFTAASSSAELLLLNISSVPASYSGDGVAMTAISDALGNNVSKLQEDVDWVLNHTGTTRIRYKALLGNYIETLRELIDEENAVLVILGTPASYGDLWQWNADSLGAMTQLPVPVLAIPQGVQYKPIRNVSFASIPGNLHSASPIASIKKLIAYTSAKLHIVSVVTTPQDKQRQQDAETDLHQQLAEVDTDYHTITEAHVVAAIGRFVEEHHIDLLVVRPRKHGIWYNLFHKSYARELAKLNLIPVMALHDEWNVN